MLPEGWRETQLGDLLSQPPRNGYSPVEADEETGLGVLSLSALTGSGLDLRQIKRAPDVPQVRAALLREGDLLVSRANTPDKVGRAALFNSDREDLSYPDLMMRARVDVDKADNRFLAYLLQSTPVLRRLQARAAGTSSTMVKLTKGAVETLKVGVPNRHLQARIAEVISTWDQAIETVDKLIDNARARKKALMQQLLTGKRRLPGFEGAWEEVEIGDVLKEVRRDVDWDDDDDYRLLSVRRRSGGAFLREVLPGHQILTKKMREAKAGDFLISKMQVLHGATAMVPVALDGCHISGSYIALIPRDPASFEMRFFDWLARTKRFYHMTYLCSYGVHIEKMTFSLSLFMKEHILIPPTSEEARAIADVLDASEAEIGGLEEQKALLSEEKRALMQQLLTGKRRVKVQEAA